MLWTVNRRLNGGHGRYPLTIMTLPAEKNNLINKEVQGNGTASDSLERFVLVKRTKKSNDALPPQKCGLISFMQESDLLRNITL